ncbi:ABC-F family ATP-binding cassette domain-containing protein [Micromonospora andamanensis]|uniref:TetR/AcrR family transcriptional regulator n=1 Tax=Micromonospora andamanensis TaxID=1287068 RepID=UPI00194EA17B|nr:TetR family transcriptional regulator [Micromonospora andamanensis]GIJ41136.1 putative transcriptional regulator, TetR family protein [Micromonospora andamanensis]
MKRSDQDRKALLADAAIDAIGEDGLRGLTHRAVDQKAGLPPGTCSYHFSTRRALLAAVLQRIAELDRADIERFNVGPLSSEMEAEALIDGATRTLRHWLGPARARSRARLLLELDPPSRQLMAETVDAVTIDFVAFAAIITGDKERAELIVALIDGLVLDELTHGAVPVDVDRLRRKVAAVTALALPGRCAE